MRKIIIISSVALLIILTLFIFLRKKESISPIEKMVIKNFDKEIVFPDSIYFMDNDKKLRLVVKGEILNKNKKKIFVLVSGGCRPCIQEILSWSEIYPQIMRNNDVDIYFIIRSIDFKYFKKNFADDVPVGYKILFDKKDLFIRRNNLPYYHNLNTVLVNDKNRIKLIGNPIGNEEMKRLLLKTVTLKDL